ncbi:MAG TPA: endo-1,4-beta-xylanase [Polyangiaceae bacterium]|nr:endo-1,4-beta-xylanase [Polyangiaceae bacterium]
MHAKSDLVPRDSLADHFDSILELGVALEPEHLFEQQDTVLKHFRRITAENAMKWGRLCPTPGQYRWEAADQIAQFARRYQLRMTGHTLLWHQMQPEWLFTDGAGVLSPQRLAERLREHVFRVVERYADVVDNWDVANEVISEAPTEFWRGAHEGSQWYGVFGDATFVDLAFQYAAEAVDRYCPSSKLYYNDYNLERADKRDKALEMVRRLRARGVRVDGIGLQGHVTLDWPTPKDFGKAIDEVHAQNLLCKVSELDVSIYPVDEQSTKLYYRSLEASPELETRVAQRYLELFEAFVERSSYLSSIVFWGLSDDHSWLNHYPVRRLNYPLLIGRDHQPKQALHRLLQLPIPGSVRSSCDTGSAL